MRQREGRRNTVAEGSCKKPRGGRDSRASGTKRNDSLVERRNGCEASMIEDEPGEVESGLCTEHSGKALLDLKQGEWITGKWAE